VFVFLFFCWTVAYLDSSDNTTTLVVTSQCVLYSFFVELSVFSIYYMPVSMSGVRQLFCLSAMQPVNDQLTVRTNFFIFVVFTRIVPFHLSPE